MDEVPQDQVPETIGPEINEDFLMITCVGDYAGQTKSTQTEQKVREISKDLIITNHEIITSKRLIKGLTIVLDKVWTTFLAFNIVVLPCIVGMSLHHLNLWMGNVVGNSSNDIYADLGYSYRGLQAPLYNISTPYIPSKSNTTTITTSSINIVVAFVLACCLFTGLPLYIFFLTDMDNIITDLVNGKITLPEITADQASQTSVEEEEVEEKLTPQQPPLTTTSNETEL